MLFKLTNIVYIGSLASKSIERSSEANELKFARNVCVKSKARTANTDKKLGRSWPGKFRPLIAGKICFARCVPENVSPVSLSLILLRVE